MDEVIYLEVLEGDSVHARHRLDRFPVTVGRGYSNDVILDDPKVSAAHLSIERSEEGALLLRDVGSTNGTFRVEPWAQLGVMTLTPDTRVTVGDTVLRFRGRGHAVEDTLVAEAPAAPRQRLFDRPGTFLSALGAAVGVSVLSSYLTGYDKTDWGELVFSVLLPIALALVWAGCWAIASKIARRQFHFRAHGAIGSLALLCFIAMPGVLTLLSFSLSLEASASWLSLLSFLGLMAWGLFWHLRYVTRWETRRLWTVISVIVLGFGVLTKAEDLLGNEDFSVSLDFPRSLLPQSFRLVRAVSLDDFFEETADLQKQVDALVKEGAPSS